MHVYAFELFLCDFRFVSRSVFALLLLSSCAFNVTLILFVALLPLEAPLIVNLLPLFLYHVTTTFAINMTITCEDD